MKKKILSLLLAICMIIPCVLTLNACGSKDEFSKYLFFYWSNDECAVTLKEEYRAEKAEELSGMDFVIPETYKGKPVQIIDAEAFKNSPIRSIVIPDSVTVIMKSAFYGCEQLESVSMPSSAHTIYPGAFKGVGVEYLIISSSLKYLGNDVFDEDIKLYYNGSAAQFAEVQTTNWSNQGPYTPTENEKWYFYSEDISDISSYIEPTQQIKGLWNYNANQEIESIAIEYGNTVNGNAYAYTNSVVTLTDEYWEMLLSAKAQGMLESVLEPSQVTLFNESNNKEEFAQKLETLNQTVLAGMRVVFADGKFTLWQGETQYSQPLDYVEVSGAIYYNLRDTYVKAYILENGKLVEDASTEFGGSKHYYELQAQ